MELLSTIESLSHYLESFAEQIGEIGSWMSSWDQDPRIKANIADANFGMTKKACLTIIVNAHAVVAAIHLIDHVESTDLPKCMAIGGGMPAFDWIPVLDNFENADCSPVEYQRRVVLDVLTAAQKAVREFIKNKLYPVVLSERLGPHARLAFQHYLFFHREHMNDAFLMLQGLLVHGLDRRFANLPALIYRMEQFMSRIESMVFVSRDGMEPDDQNGAVPDISAWAVPKQ
jgi:hypothetical protein